MECVVFSAEAGELAEKAARAIGQKNPKKFPGLHKVIPYDLNSELTGIPRQKIPFLRKTNIFSDLGPALFPASCRLFQLTDILYEKRAEYCRNGRHDLVWLVLGARFRPAFLAGMVGRRYFAGRGCLLPCSALRHLSANPKARKIILCRVLGLFGTFAHGAPPPPGRFCRALPGLGRQFSASGRLPNIFKTAWLFLGSFLFFCLYGQKSGRPEHTL